MKYTNYRITIIAILVFLTGNISAQHTAQFRSGQNITSSYGAFVVEDHQWKYMRNTPNWATEFTNHKVKNYITLERRGEEGTSTYFDNAWSLTYQFDVKGFNLTTGLLEPATTYTITIDYDPVLNYKDIAVVEIGDYHRYLVDNISVVPTGLTAAEITDDIVLTGHMDIQRFYNLDLTLAPSLNYNVDVTNNEVDLDWNFYPGAAEYDIEWLFNYDGSAAVTAADFRKRATRVSSEENNYSISLIYESYVVNPSSLHFRVRPVGRAGTNFEKRVEGAWAPVASYAIISSGLVDDLSYKNWQYGAAYAEHGKRMETMSFYDGSGRLRQTVGKNNTDNTTIVSETYYDFEGRAALNTIASPTGNNVLKYYSDYSLNTVAVNQKYSKLDFDVASKLAYPSDLSHNHSQHNYSYYDPTNPDLNNENAYLPDAQGNGYARTIYGMDGRVKKASGIGENFKIGSGHETSVYYGTPSQTKLDRLFGSDAGYAQHYKVNATVDPNGQVSVTYTNLAGATIATCLAGQTPLDPLGNPMVDPLDYQDEQGAITDDFTDFNTYDATLPGWSVNKALFVSAPGSYTFAYDIASLRYLNLCDNTTGHGCAYVIVINIYDDYNQIIHTESMTYNTGENATPLLPISPAITFTKALNLGSYTVEKVLMLDQTVLAQELADFEAIIDNCVDPLGYAYSIDLSECEDCAYTCSNDYPVLGSADNLNCLLACYEPADNCDALLERMQADMSPGGFYYEEPEWMTSYVWDVNDMPSWNNSGFNVAIAGWAYADNLGVWQEEWVEPCVGGTGDGCFTAPNDHWEDNWNGTGQANSLIQYHPEYCHYQWCIEPEVQASKAFDHQLWVMSYTHAAHANFGFVSGGSLANNFLSFDPFWDTTTPMDNLGLFTVQMTNELNNYGGSGNSMWDIVTANAGTGATNDEVWTLFVQAYTSTKAQIMENYKTAAAGYGCLYLLDVNPADGIADQRTCDTNVPTDFNLILNDQDNDPENDVYDTEPFYCMTAGAPIINQSIAAGIGVLGSGSFIEDYNDNSDCEQLASGSFTISSGSGITSAQVNINGIDISGSVDLLTGSPTPTDMANRLVVAINNHFPASGADYLASYSTNIVTLYAAPGTGSAVNGHVIGLVGVPVSSTSATVEGGINFEVCFLEAYNNDDNCEQMATTTITLQSYSGGVFTGADVLVGGVSLTGGGVNLTAIDEVELAALLADHINMRAHLTGYYAVDNVDLSGGVTLTIYAAPGSGIAPNGLTVTTTLAANGAIDPMADGTAGIACQDLAPLNCLCESFRSDLDVLDLNQTIDYSLPSSALNITDVNAIRDAYNTHYGSNVGWINITSAHILSWWDNCISSLTTDYGQSPEGWNVTLETFDHELVPQDMKCWIYTDDCGLEELQLQAYYSNSTYAFAIEALKAEFLENYIAHCLGVQPVLSNAHFSEALSVSYTDKEYHYTLYYYDQSGNLVQTVPPQGVAQVPDAQLPAVKANRATPTDPATPRVLPAHSMQTKYTQNSLNEVLTDNAPDHEGNQTWYDKIGRIRFSQDPVQQATGKYLYIKYDGLGRAVESGESDELFQSAPFFNGVDDITFPIAGNYRTFTFYDEPASSVIDNFFSGGQDPDRTLRNRVATTAYRQVYNPNKLVYDHATHYRYDIHGNVVELYQEHTQLAELNDPLSAFRFDLKHMKYDFDLVSGVVNQLTYQDGFTDQMMHRYEYDADNRLEKAWTSMDGYIWDEDVEYFYYKHGPLARIELGDDKVQGCDYATTIQGWTKGMNSEGLTPTLDMGKDGEQMGLGSYAGLHSKIASDVTGYTLGYFLGDYQDIAFNPTTARFDGDVSVNSTLKTESSDLYNRNVSRMVTSTPLLNSSANWETSTVGYAFRYDQLNRFKRMRRSLDYTTTTNAWGSLAYNTDYEVSTGFDKNGNLLRLNRNAYDPGKGGSGNGMDQLDYTYDAGTNQLNFVYDILNGTEQDGQLDDITSQTPNNYSYDAKGQLIQDKAEQIANIVWRPDGKVEKIERFNSATVNAPDLEFQYDASGMRILKIVKPRTGGMLSSALDWDYTYYVHDASGNVMAVYDRDKTDPVDANILLQDVMTLKEQYLFGAKRIGVRNANVALGGMKTQYTTMQLTETVPVYPLATLTGQHQRIKGLKSYELTEHRSNVMAVISDKRVVENHAGGPVLAFSADVIAGNDYFPYGMLMPGRHDAIGGYRYGFQGQESDDELKGEGNSVNYKYRMHDARLGRFFAVDPLAKEYPELTPYQFSANQPIHAGELEGLESYDYIGAFIDKLTRSLYSASGVEDQLGTYSGSTYQGDVDNRIDQAGKAASAIVKNVPIVDVINTHVVAEMNIRITKGFRNTDKRVGMAGYDIDLGSVVLMELTYTKNYTTGEVTDMTLNWVGKDDLATFTQGLNGGVPVGPWLHAGGGVNREYVYKAMREGTGQMALEVQSISTSANMGASVGPFSGKVSGNYKEDGRGRPTRATLEVGLSVSGAWSGLNGLAIEASGEIKVINGIEIKYGMGHAKPAK
ncbi:MAG: hypothetical protein COB15_06210 [Flavobacteriales bacterium]|nr:MAG: hypothetical protein COB15_06210 [Flavobacteriales bacterium]